MTVHTPAVAVTAQDGLLIMQIQRPEKKNALTAAMYEALASALTRAAQDPEIRVMVLTGTRDCFASGNDLADFMDNPPTDETSPVFRFLLALSQAEKPILAAVGGPAIGIGTTLLLHCDLIYASVEALFQMPFINLGLSPEGGSSLLLPLRIGHQRAAELLLLGEPFGAQRALELGLINGLYPGDRLEAEVLDKARRIAAKPPASVLLTKSLLKRAQTQAVRDTLSLEARLFMERLQSPEAAEAFQAFFERRQADFSRFR